MRPISISLQIHDIAFTRARSGWDLFASVDSDGSVRLFNLRYISQTTINCPCFKCKNVSVLSVPAIHVPVYLCYDFLHG